MAVLPGVFPYHQIESHQVNKPETQRTRFCVGLRFPEETLAKSTLISTNLSCHPAMFSEYINISGDLTHFPGTGWHGFMEEALQDLVCPVYKTRLSNSYPVEKKNSG